MDHSLLCILYMHRVDWTTSMLSYPCESKRDLKINAHSCQGNTYCQSAKYITMLDIFLKIQLKAFSIVCGTLDGQ